VSLFLSILPQINPFLFQKEYVQPFYSTGKIKDIGECLFLSYGLNMIKMKIPVVLTAYEEVLLKSCPVKQPGAG
jgi:hypothetical protein